MGAQAEPILLVEDDPTLARLLAHDLEAHGYRVTTVGSLEDAERELRSGLSPALVLLDINLPGDSGWGLLRGGLLSTGPPVQVLVMSAMPISPVRLREFGVAGYLPKPFPLATLVSTVDRLLQKESVTR